MENNTRAVISITLSLLATLLVVVGIAFFIKFYSSTYLCTALGRKITHLESLMVHEALLLQEAKGYLEKKIKNQEEKLVQLTQQTDKALLDQYKITLKDTLYTLRTQSTTLIEQLNQPEHQLLATAKEHAQQQNLLTQKNLEEQKNFLAQVNSLKLPSVVKTSKQEEIQERITALEKTIAEQKATLAKSDKDLIPFFKNELEQRRLLIQKQIEDIEKLSNFNDRDLAVVAKKEHIAAISRATKDIASQKQILSLPDTQIIQDARNRINREILALKVKSLHNKCK